MTRQSTLMSREWDEIARQNPYYGIFSWPDFQDASDIDVEKFEASGKVQVDTVLASIGLTQTHTLRMLEIGCGLGRMTHRFAELFEEVYALDISQKMIDGARAKWGHLPNVRFVKGNGEDLVGIMDGSIHFVFSFLVLQHVTAPEIVLAYIRECARVLCRSGVAFLQFNSAPARFPARIATSHRDRLHTLIATKAPLPVVSVLRWLKRRFFRSSTRSSRYWWNALLWEPEKVPNPDLTRDITSKTVWHGCSVPVKQIRQACQESGLHIRSIEGVGTQYTFLTAIKQI